MEWHGWRNLQDRVGHAEGERTMTGRVPDGSLHDILPLSLEIIERVERGFYRGQEPTWLRLRLADVLRPWTLRCPVFKGLHRVRGRSLHWLRHLVDHS